MVLQSCFGNMPPFCKGLVEDVNILSSWGLVSSIFKLRELYITVFIQLIESYSLSLIPFNDLDSDVLLFTSTWKMVKDTPNHILENMVVSDHTSRKIPKDDIS